MRLFRRSHFLKQVSDQKPVVKDGKLARPEPWVNKEAAAIQCFFTVRNLEIEEKDADGQVIKGADGKPLKKAVVAASTPDPDRYDDVIDQGSINFKHWKAAMAPMLHCHDSGNWFGRGIVIGRAVPESIRIGTIDRPDLPGARPEQLLAFLITPEWDNHPSNPDGQRIAHQWGTFINTVSIGFVPHQVCLRRMLPKEHWAFSETSDGLFYSNCEIYEISAVPIPANPWAMELEDDSVMPTRNAPAPIPRSAPPVSAGGRFVGT